MSDSLPGTPKGEFLLDVIEEIRDAREKFPSATHQLAALTEEVGELNKALIEEDCRSGAPEAVWAEAVQVAAMACRVATEGDESFSYECPIHPDDA